MLQYVSVKVYCWPWDWNILAFSDHVTASHSPQDRMGLLDMAVGPEKKLWGVWHHQDWPLDWMNTGNGQHQWPCEHQITTAHGITSGKGQRSSTRSQWTARGKTKSRQRQTPFWTETGVMISRHKDISCLEDTQWQLRRLRLPVGWRFKTKLSSGLWVTVNLSHNIVYFFNERVTRTML